MIHGYNKIYFMSFLFKTRQTSSIQTFPIKRVFVKNKKCSNWQKYVHRKYSTEGIIYAAITGDDNLLTNEIKTSNVPVQVMLSQKYNGLSPIHIACLNGNYKIVKKLIDLGDNVEATVSLDMSDGVNQMHTEDSLLGKTDVFNDYVHHFESDSGFTPLHMVNIHYPVLIGKSYTEKCKTDDLTRRDIIKLLVDKGANVHRKTLQYHLQPIHLASMYGFDQCIRQLYEYGADIDSLDNKARSPIFLSVKYGNPSAVQTLIDLNANINIRHQGGGFSLLHLATELSELEIIKLLVKNGADINMKMKYDEYSPLMIACKKGDVNMARILIEMGANVNQRDIQGKSPLHIACENDYPELVKLLIEEGKASTDIKDRAGDRKSVV